MPGFRQILGTTALLSAVLGAVLAIPPAVPASAAQGVFVEVNPNTIQAGFRVGIRASCGEDLNPASVTSGAFGQVTLNPFPGSERLRGSATVPEHTRAGAYRVDLRCVNGATASADLFVLGMARPTRGPDTGAGGTAAAATAAPTDHAPALFAGAGVAALAAGVVLLGARRRRTG